MLGILTSLSIANRWYILCNIHNSKLSTLNVNKMIIIIIINIILQNNLLSSDKIKYDTESPPKDFFLLSFSP